jgi:hypothetical protein
LKPSHFKLWVATEFDLYSPTSAVAEEHMAHDPALAGAWKMGCTPVTDPGLTHASTVSRLPSTRGLHRVHIYSLDTVFTFIRLIPCSNLFA